jgi:hypothetical protein
MLCEFNRPLMPPSSVHLPSHKDNRAGAGAVTLSRTQIFVRPTVASITQSVIRTQSCQESDATVLVGLVSLSQVRPLRWPMLFSSISTPAVRSRWHDRIAQSSPTTETGDHRQPHTDTIARSWKDCVAR